MQQIKPIGGLPIAGEIRPTDRFVLEQNGAPRSLTGQTLINWLTQAADGHGGIRKIEKVSTSGKVDTYRIYLADLTFYDFTVTNGEDGFSPIAKVTQTETGAVISITDANGTTKAVVYDSNKDSVTIESVTGETKQLPAGTATTIASVSVKAGRYLVIANATFPAYPNLEKAEYVHMLGVNTSASFDHGKATAVGNVKSHRVDLNVATVVTLPSDGAIYMLGYAAETSTVTNCNLYAVQIVGKNGKNGVDGKSAYDYALDGGYTGTEKQFSEKMAGGTFYITIVQDVTTGVITCANTVMEAAAAFKNGKPICATFHTSDFSEYYNGNVLFSALDEVDAFVLFEFVDIETHTGKRPLVKGEYHGVNDEWSIASIAYPPYTYGTTDLTTGNSALTTGNMHFVYE